MKPSQEYEFPYNEKEHKELLKKKRLMDTFLSKLETRKLISFTKQTKTALSLDNTYIERIIYHLYYLFIGEFLDKVNVNSETILVFCNNLTKIERMLDSMLTEHEAYNIRLDLNEYYLKNDVWIQSDKAKFSSVCDEISVLSLEVEEALKLAIKNTNLTNQIEKDFSNQLQSFYSKFLLIERVELAIEISKYSKD